MQFKRLQAFAACVLLGFPIVVFAQEGKYPSRPVRILVPFTAGTNADTVARLFAQKLSERLGQPLWWRTARAREASWRPRRCSARPLTVMC